MTAPITLTPEQKDALADETLTAVRAALRPILQREREAGSCACCVSRGVSAALIEAFSVAAVDSLYGVDQVVGFVEFIVVALNRAAAVQAATRAGAAPLLSDATDARLRDMLLKFEPKGGDRAH